jgi:hypothetical protein
MIQTQPRKIRHKMLTAALFWIFLATSVTCVDVSSHQFAWFTQTDPNPLQAVKAIQQQSAMKHCEDVNIFDFRLNFENPEKEGDIETDFNLGGKDGKVIEIVNTILVDGCILDCQGREVRSSVTHRPVMIVRNGGVVQNCAIVLVPSAKDIDSRLPADHGGLWGIGVDPDEYEGWLPTTGIQCDSGDCTLKTISCAVSDKAREEFRYFVECIRVESTPSNITDGAASVEIQGGQDIDQYSEYGITIRSTKTETSSNVTLIDGTPTTVSIQDFEIQSQSEDGIWIQGGARSVKIANSNVSGNAKHGIRLEQGDGVEFFAVLGSTVHDNGIAGIYVDQEEYLTTVIRVVIAQSTFIGNGDDGIGIKQAYQVDIDDCVMDDNGDDGLDVENVVSASLNRIMSQDNAQNGVVVWGPDTKITVSKSIFRFNGKKDDETRRWNRAGIYIDQALEVELSAVISRGNGMDGYFLYNIKQIKLTDVDAVSNGNDGYQITIGQEGGFNSMVVDFNRVRACGNGNSGIELVSSEERLIKFYPLAQVAACASHDNDFVMRGKGEILFVMPSGIESKQALGLTADSCKQYPGDVSCHDEQRFLRCSEELCLVHNAMFLNGEVV